MQECSVSPGILRARVCLGVVGLLFAASPMGCGNEAPGSPGRAFVDAGSNSGTEVMPPDPFLDAPVARVPPAGTWDLPFNVVDAAYSAVLERILIASDSPQAALYYVRTADLCDCNDRITLGNSPRCVPSNMSREIVTDANGKTSSDSIGVTVTSPPC